MRHLEIKQEDLNELEILENEALKVEMPELNLEECEQLMKSEFINENTVYVVVNNLEYVLNSETELNATCEPSKKIESRKSRRKALTPQRVQAGNSRSASTNNNTEESSRDLPESIISDISLPECPVTDSLINGNLFNSDSELPDEDLLQDIDEENIFKGIQNETG